MIFTDSINPTNIKTITRGLCIDTIFRENLQTKPTDFLFKLTEPINNVLSIKLASMELPNMWYSFSSANKSNIFTVHCYNIPDKSDTSMVYDESYVIQIPSGNYLACEFQEIVNNMFNNISGGLAFIRYEVSGFTTHSIFRAANRNDIVGTNPYPNDLNATNFYFTVEFHVDSLPLIKTAGWMMGFRKDRYTVRYDNTYDDIINSVNYITEHAFLESESSYGSSVTQYLFLEIDDFQRNCVSDTIITSASGSSYSGKNILARIAVSSGHSTIIFDNGADKIFKKRVYFGPTRLEKIHVRLKDKFGDTIDLNANDFSFVLEIEQLYSH